MRVVSVVGNRPQLVKLAPVSAELIRLRVEHVVLHTGQHHDPTMVEQIYRPLGLAPPDINLGLRNGSHGEQTGRMVAGIEKTLTELAPDRVLLYGDTNSTLAGGLAACKLPGIATGHVEAGVRSNERTQPEELNRRVVDRLADRLFAPTTAAVGNLKRAGLGERTSLTGDVMVDALMSVELDESAPRRRGLSPGEYIFITLHRAENVDDRRALTENLNALRGALDGRTALFPLHPRTGARLEEFGLEGLLSPFTVTPPLPYIETLSLVRGAAAVITDSGGLQKEAALLGAPCVTLRQSTEWPETVACGANRLAGHAGLKQALGEALSSPFRLEGEPFGDGRAAGRIVNELLA